MPKPPDLAPEVERLVKRAQAKNVNVLASRIPRYALLHAAAAYIERSRAYADGVKKERTALAVALEFGIGKGEEIRPEEVARMYGKARAAMARVHPSAGAALAAVRRLVRVLEKDLNFLPNREDFEIVLEELRIATRWIENLGRSTTVPGHYIQEAARREAVTTARRPGKNLQTLFWWFTEIPDYRGKWTDMHTLALAWNISTIQDSRSFRAYVLQKIGKARFEVCPELAISK